MKLKKISKILIYFSIAMSLSLSLSSCQDDETEITSPEPSGFTILEDRLVLLLNRTVTDEDVDFKIDCVDFIYPISISTFDTSFDVANTNEIESDAQFLSFLETLEEDSLIASLNYPIETIFVGESTPIEISDNIGLQNTLLDGQGTNCNGDPLTVQDCTRESINSNLIDCAWTIRNFSANNELEEYTITFNDELTFSLFNNTDEVIPGEWRVTEENDQLTLHLLNELIDISWQIVECSDEFLQASNDTDTIVLIKDCTNFSEGCPQEFIINNLTDCTWVISSYSVNPNLEAFIINFRESDGGLTILVPGVADRTFDGDWEVLEEDNLSRLNISSEIIDFNWEIVECGDDFIQASGDEGSISLFKNCVDIIEDPEITAAKELIVNEGCIWQMDRYIVGEDRPFDSLVGRTFEFNDQGTFVFNDVDTLFRGEWKFEKDGNDNLILILDPFLSLPDYIDFDYTIDTIREGFMLWSANNTEEEIITGFEQICL